MSRAYSSDLRQRIVDAISQGKSRRAAATDFKVSVATAVRLKQRSDRTGSVEPSRRGQPVGGGKLGPYRDAIIGKVEARPDITMPDLAIWLETHHGVSADPSNLSKLLCLAGFTYKNCENTKPEPTMTCGRPSERSAICSRSRSVGTTSAMQDALHIKRPTL